MVVPSSLSKPLLVVVACGLLFTVYAMVLTEHLYSARPRQPDPASGHIYADSFRGEQFFVSHVEHVQETSIPFVFMGITALCIILHRRQLRRRSTEVDST